MTTKGPHFSEGSGMQDDDPAIPAKKLRTPLEALRMDKTALSVISLKDSGSDDKEYWRTQSTTARLHALEFMRQVMYGYNPITDRVERVFEVIPKALLDLDNLP
jgi:hypothetical protein